MPSLLKLKVYDPLIIFPAVLILIMKEIKKCDLKLRRVTCQMIHILILAFPKLFSHKGRPCLKREIFILL